MTVLQRSFTTLLFVAFVTVQVAGQTKKPKATDDHAEAPSKTVSKAEDKQDFAKEMDKVFAKWNKPDSPGAAVAVAKDGKVVFKKGYGMANLEYSIPVTSKTVFHIASVSKQFATFSILLLEDQKKLSLDDDIRKHIPEVPDFGHKITLKHLAHHTSGMRDQWSLLTMAGWRMDDVITKNNIMSLVKNQRELNFKPGEKHVYCNTGYTLLAEVVARVSGKSFAEFTKENIFIPLDMKDTLFYDDHELIVPNRAYSYKPSPKGRVKSVLNYANVGATSLFTTVEDLAKWAMNFENPKVGNRKLMDKMKVRCVLNNGKKIGYALGQVVGKYRGLDNISHGGADAGYRTYFTRFPGQKFSVAIFSNDASFSPGALCNQVVDIYLKDKLAKKAPKKPDAKPKEKKVLKADPKLLKKYAGNYRLVPGMFIKVSEKNGKLFAQATGQSQFPLAQLSDSEFEFKPAKISISFQLAKGDGPPEMSFKQGAFSRKMKASKPFDSSKLKLADYEGVFHSPELSTEYKVRVVKNKLVLEHFRLGELRTQPIGQDQFAVPNLGRVKFTRNDKKEINGFKATSGRVVNLQFNKVAK